MRMCDWGSDCCSSDLVRRHLLKHSGRETILSFGIKRKKFNELSLKQLFRQLPGIVPEADRAFLASFEGMMVAGDYAFVHAGIDPGLPLSQQRRADLLWIRERFLRHPGPFEKVIVHGHPIFDKEIGRASCRERVCQYV